jgi:nuclear transport factor 2 (NTF2) superfamily protein
MLTEATFADWMRRYEAAWETRDPDAAMAIFTADATYRETPFVEPMAGREAIGDYWRRNVTVQRDVDFEFSVFTAYGETGLAWWRSRFDLTTIGQRIELNGIFHCRFREDAGGNLLCYRFEEWWHSREIGAT